MIRRSRISVSVNCVLALLATVSVSRAQTAPTFTYQGQLKKDNSRLNTPTDMKFSLWDAETFGNKIGPTLKFSADPNAAGAPINVAKGLFQAELDFGAGAFDGGERWLAIEVRNPAGGGVYDAIAARQKLTPAPYAVHSVGQSTLSASDGSPANALVVDASGSVGIGTATPPWDLSVESTGNPTLYLRNPNNAQGWRMTAGSSGLKFATADGAATIADVMQLRPGGNVGIGTSSPGAELHVRSVNVESSMLLDTGATGGRRWELISTADGSSAGAGKFVIEDLDAGGVGRFAIDASGRVGVNTPNPTDTLTVNGTACRVDNSPNWNMCSDARLKQNISPLQGALDRLLDLRGVTFEWKEPGEHEAMQGTQTGLIAQEVEKVFPDWVQTRDDGIKTLGPRGMTALTVEALRELKSENDALRADIRELRAMVDQLIERETRNALVSAKED